MPADQHPANPPVGIEPRQIVSALAAAGVHHGTMVALAVTQDGLGLAAGDRRRPACT